MRPTFLLNLELRLVSAIACKTVPHALRTGVAVLLMQAYETPWGSVPAGSKGHVDHVDETSGLVEILMEGAEPALYNWNNKLVLVPFDTDDLAECLVCSLRFITKEASASITHLKTG